MLTKKQNNKPVLTCAVEQLQVCIADPDADYPKELIEKVVADKDGSTPKLLAIAENFFNLRLLQITPEQWREAMVAFFILSKFREKRAFPLVLRLFEFPYKEAEEILGDVLTEHLPEFLASTFEGNFDVLYEIVSNQHFEEYSRSAIISAYVVLYKKKIMSREQIIDLFSRLFDELYDDLSIMPTEVVCGCAEIGAFELKEKIDKYFDKGIVETFMISKKEVEESYLLSEEKLFEESASGVFDVINDLEDDMGWLFRKDD